MLSDELKPILEAFAVKLTVDLNASLNDALRKGGRKQPQDAKLIFTHKIGFEGSRLFITINASGKYWRYIESGRKKGIMPPSSVFGKKYQAEIGISPQKIIQAMQQKYNDAKGIKSKAKKLPFDKATKQMSFLIARGIKNKGIKPKPFFNKVVEDGRLEDLGLIVSEVLKKKIIIDFELN